MNVLTAPAPWNHEQAGQTETVEATIRVAMTLASENHVTVSPSKLSRLIRAHIRKRGSVPAPRALLEAYVLTYADPTGETAVRNLMSRNVSPARGS